MCGSVIASGRVCPDCGNIDSMTICLETHHELHTMVPVIDGWLCELCHGRWMAAEEDCSED